MSFADTARRALHAWWILGLGLLLGAATALFVTSQLAPVYQSTLTFYVVAPASERLTPLQADELVRGRIVAYPGLMTSDQFLDRIIETGNLSLTTDEVRGRVTAIGDSDTRTLDVTVRDVDPSQSLNIASEIAANFGQLVEDVERAPGSTTPGTSLTAISGPSLESAPVSPRPTLNLAIGALLGFGLAAAVVVMLLRMDTAIRTVEQLAGIDARPLAAVPNDGASRTLSPGSTAHGRTRLAEGIRGLRTSAQLHANEKPFQLLAVTSPGSSEGRSTISLNLALSFAETKKRVLLVEADLDNPGLASHLKLPHTSGLTDVLQGRIKLLAAIQRHEGVDVLTAGSPAEGPFRFLASEDFDRILTVLRAEYDLVILETSSLRASADAALVCRAADATVLVVRYGRTASDGVAYGFQILASEQCRVLGTVLNMAPGRRPPSLSTTAILSNGYQSGPNSIRGNTLEVNREQPSVHRHDSRAP